MRGPASPAAAQICRVASIPSSTGMRTSISTTSGRCSRAEPHRLGAVRGARDDGDVGLRVEQRREPRAHDLLVVGDERADHDDASRWRAASRRPRSRRPRRRRTRTCRRRSSRGRACRRGRGRRPARRPAGRGRSPGRGAAARPRRTRPRRRRRRRARAAARWSAPPGRSGTRRGRCPPAAASTLPCRISRTFAPASRAVSTSSASCVEPRLRRAVGLAADVLAQHAEQPARLGQRVARRRRDRLEAAASVGGELGRRQPRRLALDRDHREMVRDDVVQLARDAGALLHRGLLAHALGHRLLRRVERGDRLRALARRLADEHRRGDEQERPDAREARRCCRRTARSRGRGTAAGAATARRGRAGRRGARPCRAARRAR